MSYFLTLLFLMQFQRLLFLVSFILRSLEWNPREHITYFWIYFWIFSWIFFLKLKYRKNIDDTIWTDNHSPILKCIPLWRIIQILMPFGCVITITRTMIMTVKRFIRIYFRSQKVIPSIPNWVRTTPPPLYFLRLSVTDVLCYNFILFISVSVLCICRSNSETSGI